MYSPSDFESLWQQMNEHLRRIGSFSEVSFKIWFDTFKVIYCDEKNVVFSTDNEMRRDAILRLYGEVLAKTVKEIAGCDAFEIVVDPSTAPISPAAQAAREEQMQRRREATAAELRSEQEAARNPSPEPTPEPPKPTGERRLYYNDEYTFDNFIVGKSNEFAHAAALAVANKEDSATRYNPLLFYGSSGLGKTHLMYAIINKLLERSPDLNAIYINGEDFTNQLIEAIGRQKNVEFREKYRKADVLLIDDIQFIAGKDSTQEEFFHTFNALYRDHKQIIVTSDRPPNEMKTLEERIRTRLEQGLMADIGEPDYELRLAILQKKAEHMGLVIDQEMLSYIAERLNSNIRQLEGIIKRISATHLLNGAVIDMELVKTLVPMFQQESQSTEEMIARIMAEVEKRRGISHADLIGTNRSKNIATARNMAMYLIRQVLELSNKAIGDIFGNRDHTTVISNLRAAEKLMKTDAAFEAEVAVIRREIRK